MSHSIKIDGLTLMRGNNKLGKVLNISLPPEKTCDHNLPCYKSGCYGIKFYRMRPGCRTAWDGNWEMASKHRNDYMRQIHGAIISRNPDMFRWHVAGDIPDAAYLHDMIYIASWTPHTRHLVFTKKYDILLQTVEYLPKNLNIVVSAWPGLELPEILMKKFPVAWMKDPKMPDPRIPKRAVHCDGGCSTCAMCWEIKAGKSVYFDKH